MTALGTLEHPLSMDGARAEPDTSEGRLRAMVLEHFQPTYRLLRRILPGDAAEDATQQTFAIAARKIGRIEPGSERAFLRQTAIWVASHTRRVHARRREVSGDEALEQHESNLPTPEEVAAEGDRRRLLDEVLEAMPFELRTVFVLFELEETQSHEIAALLGIPAGTVASRLRRAREEFHTQARRARARLAFQGEMP
jgi:RNA polymerase sigma-70 factor (ECF subfamily)